MSQMPSPLPDDKIVKIGTPKIIAVFILKFDQGGFSIQKCVQQR